MCIDTRHVHLYQVELLSHHLSWAPFISWITTITACFSTFFGGRGQVRKLTTSPSFGTNSPSILKRENKTYSVTNQKAGLSISTVWSPGKGCCPIFLTIRIMTYYHPSLRNQPTFRDTTGGFLAKWHLQNGGQKFHADDMSLPRSA